jgi:hypothetical protein
MSATAAAGLWGVFRRRHRHAAWQRIAATRSKVLAERLLVSLAVAAQDEGYFGMEFRIQRLTPIEKTAPGTTP